MESGCSPNTYHSNGAPTAERIASLRLEDAGIFPHSKAACLQALAALASDASLAADPHGLASRPSCAALLVALRQHCQAYGFAADRTVSQLQLEELLYITRQLLRLRLRRGTGVVKEPGHGWARGGRRVGCGWSGRAQTDGYHGSGASVAAGSGEEAADAGDAARALLDAVAAAAVRCLEALERGSAESHGSAEAAVARAHAAPDVAPAPRRALAAAGAAAALLHNLVKLDWCRGGGGGSADGSGGDAQRLTEAVAGAAVRYGLAAEMGVRALQDLVWALGKLGAPHHSLPPVRQLLSELAERLADPHLLAAMSSVGLSMVVYGMGKVGAPYGDGAVRRAVCAAVAAATAAPDCCPQALANMAWGLSRTLPALPSAPRASPTPAPPPPPQQHPTSALRVTPLQYMTAPARPAAALHPSAPFEAPVGLLGGGALCSPTSGSALRPADSAGDTGALRDALRAIAAAAARQLDGFKPRELSNLLGALAGLGALSEPRVCGLLAQSRPYVRRRLADMGPEDLAEVLYAYGTAAAAAAAAGPESGLDGEGLPMAAAAAAGTWPSLAADRADGGVLCAELAALLEDRCLAVLPACPGYQVTTMLWGFAHLPAHVPSRLLAAVTAAFAAWADSADSVLKGLVPLPPGAAPPATPSQHQGRAQEAQAQQQPRRRQGAGLEPNPGGRQQQQAQQSSASALGRRLGLDLEAMPPSQLARMLWALAKLGADVAPEALRAVCGVVRHRLPEFDAQALLMSSWALATLGCPLQPALEPLVGRLAALLPSLAPPQLAMALWSVAKLMEAAGGDLPGMATLRLFQASRGPLAAALPRLGPQSLAMVAWSYATAGVHPGEAALGALWQRAAALMAPAAARAASLGRGAGSGGGGGGAGGGMGGQALAMLGRAMAQLRCRDARAVAAFAAAVAARLAAPLPSPPPAGRGDAIVGPRAGGLGGDALFLSSVVCSLGRLGVQDGRLLHLACRRAAALAPVLTAREAIPLLWGLGAMCAPTVGASGPGAAGAAGAAAAAPSGVWVCPPGLVTALARVAEEAIRSDALAEAAALSIHPGRDGGSANGSAAAAAATHGSAQLDGGLLSMLLLACVAHRHRPPPAVLQAACLLLLRRLGALASHTLCELSWAVASLVPPPDGDFGAHALLPLPRVPLRPAAEAPLEPPPAAEAAGAGAGAQSSAAATDEEGVDPLWAAVGRLCRAHERRRRQWRRLNRGRSAALAADAANQQPVTNAHISQLAGGSERVHSAKHPAPLSQQASEPAAAAACGRGELPAAQRPSGSENGGVAGAGQPASPRHASSAAEGSADSVSGPAVGDAQVASAGARPAAVRARPSASGRRWPLWAVRISRPEPQLSLPTRLRRKLKASASARKATKPSALPSPAAPASPPAPAATAPPPAAPAPRAPPQSTSQPEPATRPTPPAALVAPIYPLRSAQPRGLAASRALLARALGLLSWRLCVARSELLTLESLVKVTWAMCVTRMYTPRLFRYCAARAVCCSTRPLERRPALLRALVEARAMLARQRPSAWRSLRLRTRWRRRMAAGGGSDGGVDGARWRLAPAEVLAAQPAEAARELLRCQAALEAAAEAAELPFEWRNTFEGERLGVIKLGRQAAFTLVLLPSWQLPVSEAAAAADGAAAAAAAPPLLPLATGAVTVRLLRLRGWLVAAVHAERWLALTPAERREQLVALYGSMREAARHRALAVAAAAAASEASTVATAGGQLGPGVLEASGGAGVRVGAGPRKRIPKTRKTGKKQARVGSGTGEGRPVGRRQGM